MNDTVESRTLSVRIARPMAEVYAFLAEPRHFPQWASGLCSAIHENDEAWLAETPHGMMRVRFTPPNDYGVLDHYVQTPHGDELYVPMRLIPNGTGCELVFTLFRSASMSAEEFARDAEWVERDLATLQQLLESVA